MDDIIRDLQGYIRRSVWFRQEQSPSYAVLTSYVLLSLGVRMFEKKAGAVPLFDAIPYLYFQGSRDGGDGKTETGILIVALTNGGSTVSISKAGLFHWLNKNIGRLLFIDEASGLPKQDYAEIIRASYSRDGAPVGRYNGSFKVYGPKIFAANKELPLSALESRCIPVEFVEAPLSFVPAKRDADQEKKLRRGSRKWIRTHADVIRGAYDRWRACEDGSIFTSQRMRQIYSPLLAIAESAGILGWVREYALDHQQQRSLRHNLSIGYRLDRVLEGLPGFCHIHHIPKGQIPFSFISEFVHSRMDGERPTEKAIVQALVRSEYRKLGSRPGGKTCYAAPSSGLLAKAWDKLASMVGQKST
jgi:hypothetical protein